MMLGSHLSVAGGPVNALRSAAEIGLDTVQIFTKNQQQWRVPPLKQAPTTAWLNELESLGWSDRTVSHASYLINLASPDDDLWNRSVELMIVEVERCDAMSIPSLVHHPGACTGSTPDEGLDRIARAYRRILDQTRSARVVLCLENTVGAGTILGRRFEELGDLRARIVGATGAPERIGFCVDTCHAHAGGYDLSTRSGGEQTLDEFDRFCGLEHLRVVHLNDSVGEVDSRRDRHAHIGEGTIGAGTTARSLSRSGFAAFVNHPALADLPMILETPKENTDAGTPMDVINSRRIRRLIDPG